MSSQHIYYSGDKRYDQAGSTYSEGAYERPVDHYYSQFGAPPEPPTPGNGRRQPAHWPGMHSYVDPNASSVNGMLSRPKQIAESSQGMQDYRTKNGKKRKTDNSDWDMDPSVRGEDRDSARSSGARHVWDKHTGMSSMSGVAYIKNSKNPTVKTVWSVLLLVAVGVMGYHLYRLISTYVEFKKQTSVEISFSSLEFPAVTICNVNPLRISQLDLASDDLVEFINSVNPVNLTDRLSAWNPEYDTLSAYYDEDYDDDDDRRRRKRRKRQTTTSSAQVRSSNFLDQVDSGFNDTRQWQEAVDSYYSESLPDSWEAESTVSAFYELEETFRENFAWELPSVRAQMGHQISDMLLQCSFAGRRCLARNFTRQLTTNYGNCYTIEYSKFISRQSGPKYGLELKLFLETDDYVPGIATSKGIQVVIHDQGTVAFPEDEGIAVKAGTETKIGLKMVQVNRLHRPYDYCTSPEDFLKRYNVKYTRTTCQNVCLYQTTVRTCKCYDILSEETRRLFRRANQRNETACESTSEIQCAERVAYQFDNNNGECQCHGPCNETTYRKTVSSREWPNEGFASLLVETVCKNNHPSCDALRMKSAEEKKSEFIRLIISYDDLNFEKLTEAAAYEIDQFLSDVGGTIGLYIGLSVLAIFEVVHLITELVIYLCCGRYRNGAQKNR